MHPSLENLLALRDGEAPPEVAAHVAGCVACMTELDSLHAMRSALRELPLAAPPPGVLDRIHDARRRAPLQRRWRYAGAFALAASVIVTVALLVRAPLELPVPVDVPARDPGIGLTELHAHSRDLDMLLTQIDAGDRVLDLATAGTIVALEDRIAALDRHLAAGEALEEGVAAALWRHRVELMEALVGMHVAQVEPVYLERPY
jgi:hypothetical protein